MEITVTHMVWFQLNFNFIRWSFHSVFVSFSLELNPMR